MTLQASIPNPFSDVPLWRLRVQISTDEHSQGESLRLRAHLQTQLVMPSTHEALAAPAQESAADAGGRALMPRTRRAARGLVQRGLQSPIAQKVTPYLERRFESWIDVQASTRPLDRGAMDLLPEPVRAMGFGQASPVRVRGEPQIETWSGRSGGERPGSAQLTVLQYNEAAKPAAKRRSKRPPLHLAASVATFYEDQLPRGRGR
jgi:hypothetical protein